MNIKTTATDFMFDNKKLSDFGMMLCNFDGSSKEDISIGNKITYTTIKTPMSNRTYFINAEYEDTITSTLQICKIACNDDNRSFSTNEIDSLLSWLVRKDGFHKFKLYQQGYEDIYFNVYFSDVQAVSIGGAVYGLTLTLTADAPYGYGEDVKIDLTMEGDKRYKIINMSSELGVTRPTIIVAECLRNCILRLDNLTSGKFTQVLGCGKNEVITMDCVHKIISTSSNIHAKTLHDDFNYEYFELVRTYENNINIISSAFPCKLHLEYNPIRKVGIV